MKNLTLEHIATACGGTYFGNESDKKKEAAGIVTDSRKVEEGFVFLAIKGERTDGHCYIPQVFQKGALAVLCETAPECPARPYILVKSSIQALQDIAEFYRAQLDCKVIGITGSVGKTSTREFIAAVLAQKYRVLETEENFNNEIGLSLTILQIREEQEAAVLEMGISHFGEMRQLSKIAKPDICVITNIGQSHMEFLGSRAGILAAKTEIFEHMAKKGDVCLNGDDDMLCLIADVNGKKPVTFGMGKENDVYADGICLQGYAGSTCSIHTKTGTFRADIPLPGRHMVFGALAAAAVGGLCGLGAEEIAAGLLNVKAVKGRNYLIKSKKYNIIDDCYNASPESMKAALDLLRGEPGRKVCILGDMGELGGQEEALHEEVGRCAAKAGIDCMIFVGKQAQAMARGAHGAHGAHCFATKEECIRALGALLQPGDTILVKASHFMAFHEIIEALCP